MRPVPLTVPCAAAQRTSRPACATTWRRRPGGEMGGGGGGEEEGGDEEDDGRMRGGVRGVTSGSESQKRVQR